MIGWLCDKVIGWWSGGVKRWWSGEVIGRWRGGGLERWSGWRNVFSLHQRRERIIDPFSQEITRMKTW